MLILDEIEKNFQEDLKKIENWPYLRRLVGLSLIHSKMNISKIKKSQLILFKIRQVLRSLEGLFNIFNNYDNIVFGLSDNFRRIDDCFVDRFCHDFIISQDKSKTLYIEKSLNKKVEKAPYKIVSYYLFRIVSSFLFVKIKPNKLLRDINNKYNLRVNFNLEEKKFVCIYKAFKYYFKVVKPKRVIVTCYSFKAAIKAANDLKIDTIEFQHGVINNNFEYDFRFLIKNNFSPKKIFVFGIADKIHLDVFKYTDNVIVGGNFFQNYVMNNFKSKNLQQNKVTICVTLQDDCCNEIMDIISHCALLNKDVQFIVVPRNIFPEIEKGLGNVNVLFDHNLYEIMKISDYHITVYSSSCFEASAFGLENMFLNLNNLSNFYYSDYIKSNDFNYIFNDKNSLSEHIKKLKINKSKKEIIEANKYYYSTYNNIQPNFF